VKETAAQWGHGRQDDLMNQIVPEGQSVVGFPQQAAVDALVNFINYGTGHVEQEAGRD
jgi:hypothetical protein